MPFFFIFYKGETMLFEQTIKKIKMVKLFIVLLSLALIFKVGYIQIIDRKTIYDKALESWQRSFPVQANRGKIYDCSGNILATDLTTASLVVVPSQIQDKATTAISLSKILQVDAKSLEEKLNKKVSIQRISPEGRQLDDEKALRIQRLNLSGVYLIKDTKRYYPLNQYLSHCLGFVGIDNQGLLGLELEYDRYLKGKNGSIDYYMDAKSNNLKMYPSHYSASLSGMNLSLTIDKKVQDVIERELNNAYDIYHPDGIWALAMNPQNGEILGMSSKPDFNPNDYKNEDSSIYNQNIPIWKTYEPGSTFKIITASACLEERVVSLSDTFSCPGYRIVEDRKIRCHKVGGHGAETFVQGIQNSCNPVFIDIGLRLGTGRFCDYFEQFGLLGKTGVDLPGEAATIMHKEENIGQVELATMSFGQSFQVTPIQMAATVSALVNGGKRVTPHFGVRILDKDKETVRELKYDDGKQIVSEETSRTMQALLESVVSEGSGKNAKIEGYHIGGKTATSQTLPRSANKYISSFIGFAPAANPQILGMCVIYNPQGVYYGGTIAAPVIRDIFDNIFPYLGIEKDVEMQYTN